MAWIYLAESQDSQLPWTNGSRQLPSVKMTNTARAFCSQECEKTLCQASQSGTTSQPCPLKDSWPFRKSTLFMVASHAKTSALQEIKRGWRESEADFFKKLLGLHKKFNPLLSFLKMSLRSRHGDSTLFSLPSPNFGMIVGGRLYLPQKLAPHTLEKDGSCLLPTVTASSYGSNQGGGAGRKGKTRLSLETMARKNLWPTPCASDWKDRGNLSQPSVQRRIQIGKQISLSMSVSPKSGRLSPLWTEWLMGYRTGHTELNALGMQWFQDKQEKPL